MIDFEVINAGNCMICRKPIILPARRDNYKLPDIFICKNCRTHIIEEDIKSKKENNNE